MNCSSEETDTSSQLQDLVSSALKMPKVTRHNSTFAPAVSLRQMSGGRVGWSSRGNHHAPSKNSQSSLSVSAIMKLSFGQHLSKAGQNPPTRTPPTANPPPVGAQERPGDPHSSKMTDGAAAWRKSSCDERVCTHVAFVLLTTVPLVFPDHVHTMEP